MLPVIEALRWGGTESWSRGQAVLAHAAATVQTQWEVGLYSETVPEEREEASKDPDSKGMD